MRYDDSWFERLKKPGFNPPEWVFGPAWLILYTLMGIALVLVLTKGLRQGPVLLAAAVFAVQLVFNILWTALFFGRQSPRAALVDIVLLWFAILATIAAFYRVLPLAAYLLIPYILWVSFATLLNAAIVRLNP
jgi:translocator protein